MCGRYRLSRRKEVVEEYFDAVSSEEDWTPRFNIAPIAAGARHPPAFERADPRPLSDALGTHSLMVERLVRRGEDDQREVGNSSDIASVPRCHEIPQVLGSGRRVLRVGADGENQAAILLRCK